MTKIRLFHGSLVEFDKFEIAPELARHTLDTLVEGYGIYLAEDKEVSMSYGDRLYEVDVDIAKITDFTSQKEIYKLVNYLSEQVGIPITDYLDLEEVTATTISGNISVSAFYKEICSLLDSTERFYMDYGNLVTYEEGCLFNKIEQSFQQYLQPVLKYYDSGLKKNIYICIKEPEILDITSVSHVF